MTVCPAIPSNERVLLAKLEEENRRIEADAKSASLTNVHSRKSSDTSQISLASGKNKRHKLTIQHPNNNDIQKIKKNTAWICLITHEKFNPGDGHQTKQVNFSFTERAVNGFYV